MKEYIVLFGNDHYHPELHYKACKYKFNTLKEARAYAREYSNSYIYRVYENGTYFAELKII